MNLKAEVAGPAMSSGVSLTVGKALALSFGIAIALAAIFVAAGVLVSQ